MCTVCSLPEYADTIRLQTVQRPKSFWCQYLQTLTIFAFLFVYVPHKSWAAYVPSYTVVYEKQDVTVHADASHNETLHRVIRINTATGAKLWGEVSRSFNADRATMAVEYAYVVQPDGKRLDISPVGIQTRDANVDSDAPFFGKEKEIYVIFPDVRIGSELHYAFHEVIKKSAYPDRFSWLDYQFPHLPVLKSEVNVTYDPAIKLRFAIRGGYTEAPIEPAAPKGYLRKSFTFSQTDAIPYESGSVADIDTAPMIVMSNYADWADVGLTYDGVARPNSQPDSAISNLAKQIAGDAKDARNQVQRLHQWVAQNIRYVGSGLSAGGYVPNPAPLILKNRYGDCKDHAALLEAMFNAVGIESSPALINSGNAYQLTPIASDWPFNHVITYIPSLDLFVDSTSRYAPTGTLPRGDMGKPVVLSRAGEMKRTPMPSPEHDVEVVSTQWVLQSNGDMTATTTVKKTGWMEASSRNYHMNNSETDQESESRKYLREHSEVGTGETHSPSSDNWSKEWVVTSKTRLQGVVNLPEPSAFSIPVGMTPGTLQRIANLAPEPPRVSRRLVGLS